MRVIDVANIMEKIAPIYLKESYDNVGLMVGDTNSEVKKILLALDCTLDVIDEAIENKVDLIITHHPLLFRKPSTITNESIIGNKIIKLIKNDISLYSSHTNLDSIENGINDTIVDMLGFSKGKIIEQSRIKGYENSGIGRIIDLDKEIQLKELIKITKDRLQLKGLRYSGNLEEYIKRIAIVNGSGQDFIDAAYKAGAKVLITGDTTYHFVSDYNEMGFYVIDIGHFPSEWLVFLKVCEKVEKEIKKIDNNIEIIKSTKAKDPYNFCEF